MQSENAAVTFFREDIKTLLGLDETKQAIAEIIDTARKIEWSHQQQMTYLPILTGIRSNTINQWVCNWREIFNCGNEYSSPLGRFIYAASDDIESHLNHILDLWLLYKSNFQNENDRKRVEALVIKQGLSYLYKLLTDATKSQYGSKTAAKWVILRLKIFWETGMRRMDFDEYGLDSLRQYLMPLERFEETSSNPGPLYASEEVFRPLVDFIRINQQRGYRA